MNKIIKKISTLSLFVVCLFVSTHTMSSEILEPTKEESSEELNLSQFNLDTLQKENKTYKDKLASLQKELDWLSAELENDGNTSRGKRMLIKSDKLFVGSIAAAFMIGFTAAYTASVYEVLPAIPTPIKVVEVISDALALSGFGCFSAKWLSITDTAFY